MSLSKTVACGVLVWASWAATLRADSINSSFGNTWTFFNLSGQSSVNSINPLFGGLSANPSQSPSYSPPVYIPAPPPPAPVSTYSPPAATFSIPTQSTPPSAPWNTPSTSSGQTADAYINFGASTYPEASSLTTGTSQPWYDSPTVTKLYGGIPNAQQQSAFTNLVLQDVQHTFALANLNPNLTTDPNTPANHTMSVVSGLSYQPNPNAIGITDVGHNGFSFIDKFSYATNVNDLATALSKNISHELMHAFGVGIHPDTTGNYIDAGTASWSLLTNANSTFSPAATSLIAATQFGQIINGGSSSAQVIDGEQEILAAPVPEPATMTLWGVGIAGVLLHHRRRRLAAAA
jgi:hypothetical protein